MSKKHFVRFLAACTASLPLVLAAASPVVAEDAVTSETDDTECLNAPAILPQEGTWVLAADLMDVGGVRTPLGGGADLPWIFLQDCGRLLIAEVTGIGQVAFEFEGSSYPGFLEALEKNLLKALKEETPRRTYYEQGTLIAYSKLLREVFDRALPGAGVPASYYSGILPHEPRIWWVLAVTDSGSMRSVLGFAFISEGGADPAPPHTQVHDWAYWKSEKPTDEDFEKAKKAAQWDVEADRQTSLVKILLEALQSAP